MVYSTVLSFHGEQRFWFVLIVVCLSVALHKSFIASPALNRIYISALTIWNYYFLTI